MSFADPQWASINRGVLICNECCSVHRSLGRHISQVRSIRAPNWPPVQKEVRERETHPEREGGAPHTQNALKRQELRSHFIVCGYCEYSRSICVQHAVCEAGYLWMSCYEMYRYTWYAVCTVALASVPNMTTGINVLTISSHSLHKVYTL